MPLALGLVALFVVSIGGALFLSTRLDHVPGQAYAEYQEPPPTPVMSPQDVRLLAMAQYLEQRKQPSAQPIQPYPVAQNLEPAPVDVGQDVEVLISMSSQLVENSPSLEDIQQRMRAAPNQYFDALQGSFGSIPQEAFQARLSSAQWIVSLAQMTSRQADAEPVIRRQFENAASEAEAVAYRSLLSTLGYPAPERAPAEHPPVEVPTVPVPIDAPPGESRSDF